MYAEKSQKFALFDGFLAPSSHYPLPSCNYHLPFYDYEGGYEEKCEQYSESRFFRPISMKLM